ncbi:penicillin-binding protein 2 [Patescibacteria group bacterium]|nr:MAG: penicillin-binding protein 2 [Patescibacteria group bacterium]
MKQSYRERSAQKRRLSFLGLLLVVLAGLVVAKLFYLQVLRHSYYLAFAENQHWMKRDIPAERGKIYVKDPETGGLYPLATNIQKDLCYTVPGRIKDPDYAAEKLAPLLKMKKQDILKEFEKSKYYVPLKHKLTEKQSEKIQNLGIEGVMVTPESWRYYPEKKLASHILGYVDWDGKGRYGLEGYFNGSLKGKPGFLEAEKDQGGQLISIGNLNLDPPKNGDDLILTIDRTVQYEIEKRLKEGVQKFGATGGSIVVMNPKSGAIIAMANYPNFNPNTYYKKKQEDYWVFNNPAINDVYEPGSIFKPVIMASAINEDKVNPTTTHKCSGYVRIGANIVRTSDLRGHGTEAMTQILENSCNVGMAFVTGKMGKGLTYDYLNRFGFNNDTGIRLHTENRGNIRNSDEWADIDLATSGFGQGLGVTSLQMVTSFSALANEGNLIQPYIVEEIIHSDGSKEKRKPKVVRQVVEKDVAQTISAMLVSAVENGVANPAKLDGYYIAGKTGTAQVAAENGDGYDSNKRITSFIGYGPVDNPRFIILVKFDIPYGGDVWGVTTAVPVYKEVAKYLLNYYRVPPSVGG